MAINKKIIVMVNFFLVVSAHAGDLPSEKFIANLWINNLNQNIDATLIKRDANYYIECALLTERNVDAKLLSHLDGANDFCLVSNDQLKADFDEESQAIKLTIPSQFFLTSRYGLYEFDRPEKANFGGFINYEVQYNNSEFLTGYNGLVDLGIFKDYWFFKNSMLYNSEAMNEKTVRIGTSLDFDFPDKLTKLTLGDATTVSNPFFNSLRFAGINWGTNYLERPGFVYWNTPQLQGTARLPSTVELYMNGVKIYNQKVSPGDYVLQTGSQINYTGNAQIVVEDVLGNRSVRTLPILINNKLLRKGLSEYNIALGKLRYNYYTSSNDYRDFLANLYYRRGLSETTSLGTNISYTQDLQNTGITWTQGLPYFVVLDALAINAHSNDGSRFLYGLSLSKEFSRMSLGISSKYAEDNFRYVGDDPLQDNAVPKFENFAYVTFSEVPFLQNINMSYAEQKYYQGGSNPFNDDKIFNIGFNRQIGNNISFGLGYFERFGAIKDSGGILNITYNFDTRNKVYLNYASENNNASVQYVHDSGRQVGLDYAIGANRRQDENIASLNVVAKTRAGDLSIQHYQYEHATDSTIGYSGAIAFLDGQVNFTKSINNAFALVKVGNYSDIDVLSALNHVEKTNKKGYAFVHDIVPYIKYDIGFDENQLPIEEKYEVSSKPLTTLNQRGYVVDFPIQHTFILTLHPQDINGANFKPGSELHLANGDVYPITSDASVTVYGMTAGTHTMSVLYGDNATCSFDVNITEKEAKEAEASSQPLRVVCK
ncbi:fimbrial biogenesis outer membrane usher protein [Acinetobacter bouvetii]|uniref:Fimbrial biogenesis outer membrane usher protein n=2 Tax=Acinetobacter TaxID=469 RepID=A0A4Q7B3A0_9GAMM|nr:fimbrial biogenesis outer membrane usher protein [Acinetobacter bouvetii]